MRSFYKWNLWLIAVLMIIGIAHDARAVDPRPTTMVISTIPSNYVMAVRQYADFDNCRADREFIISLLERFGTDIWVTCTPLGME